jgi:hypothetical protein
MPAEAGVRTSGNIHPEFRFSGKPAEGRGILAESPGATSPAGQPERISSPVTACRDSDESDYFR